MQDHAQDRGRHQDSEKPMSRSTRPARNMAGKADVEGRPLREFISCGNLSECKYIKPKTVGVPVRSLDAAVN